jgi:(S)-citramalyl-CoA lyase
MFDPDAETSSRYTKGPTIRGLAMHFNTYCRSILFTPALADARYEKALTFGADISLVDLEDSVSPAYKDAARSKAARFFAMPRTSRRPLAVRINSIGHSDGLRDLLAIRSYERKPDLVLVPKVEAPRDLEIVEQVLSEDCQDVRLMAVVETARGMESVTSIATASPRLQALVFGSADFSFSIGARMSWETLHHARARLIVAARAAGIYAVDSAFFDISDPEGLVREARLASDMGFDGKAAVHPRQIGAIHAAFSPDAATLERARKIVATSQASDHNICVVDGMMVGAPIVEAARRLLDDFDAAGHDPAPISNHVRSSE